MNVNIVIFRVELPRKDYLIKEPMNGNNYKKIRLFKILKNHMYQVCIRERLQRQVSLTKEQKNGRNYNQKNKIATKHLMISKGLKVTIVRIQSKICYQNISQLSKNLFLIYHILKQHQLPQISTLQK